MSINSKRTRSIVAPRTNVPIVNNRETEPVVPAPRVPSNGKSKNIGSTPSNDSRATTNSGNEEKLYNRSSFRKSTRKQAESEAPKNADGKMICCTCGKDIPKTITVNTKNGERKRIGYDLDHYPDTWAERVDEMKSRATQPTRKAVLNEYNRDVRVQCNPCNISHQFEGKEGTFKGVKKDD